MRHALVVVVALGCSSSAQDVTNTEPDARAAEVGGCGDRVGDVLCDLDLQGYLRDASDGLASAAAPGTFKMSEALAIGKQRYAFIFDTAFW